MKENVLHTTLHPTIINIIRKTYTLLGENMNKYKSLILVMFFLCLFTLSKTNAIVNDYKLLGKTIYIDAGHGR